MILLAFSWIFSTNHCQSSMAVLFCKLFCFEMQIYLNCGELFCSLGVSPTRLRVEAMSRCGRTKFRPHLKRRSHPRLNSLTKSNLDCAATPPRLSSGRTRLQYEKTHHVNVIVNSIGFKLSLCFISQYNLYSTNFTVSL